ncbi:MAG TPA: TRAM domain-containing protein, partial [Spirochaetota bacterium]|nr:TRAM domain-containing protein [Spirochaetota bacterium]
QAIGYLDDGTMVVVENGRRKINEEVEVTVTSIKQ